MTITPTLDGDVLSVLARHDVAFTTGQLHRILTNYSEEGIRKVLQRLSGQGIVNSDGVGNAYNYRLNRDHLAAEHIIKLADIMSTFLARLAGTLEAWEVPPVYAAVFGSAARGSMTVDSDLDLLLVRPDNGDVTRWTGNDTRAGIKKHGHPPRACRPPAVRHSAPAEPRGSWFELLFAGAWFRAHCPPPLQHGSDRASSAPEPCRTPRHWPRRSQHSQRHGDVKVDLPLLVCQGCLSPGQKSFGLPQPLARLLTVAADDATMPTGCHLSAT